MQTPRDEGQLHCTSQQNATTHLILHPPRQNANAPVILDATKGNDLPEGVYHNRIPAWMLPSYYAHGVPIEDHPTDSDSDPDSDSDQPSVLPTIHPLQYWSINATSDLISWSLLTFPQTYPSPILALQNSPMTGCAIYRQIVPSSLVKLVLPLKINMNNALQKN